MRKLLIVGLLIALAGCAERESHPATSDEANLTSSRATSLANPELESVRQTFVRATEGATGDFHGYAAGFSWKTNVAIGAELSAEQKSFLATELIQKVDDALDRVPYGVELAAADVTSTAGLAKAELRLEKDRELETALERARASGHAVLRFEPRAPTPGARRTAGALLVLDVTGREALVLYGRRGPAPTQVHCDVTKMHSHEFEEALSKDEYPNVSLDEIPLTGDIVFKIGVNKAYSNANAEVLVTRNGAALHVDAKRDESFLARLTVEGTNGTVYGDRDRNGEPNKAATLACTGL